MDDLLALMEDDVVPKKEEMNKKNVTTKTTTTTTATTFNSTNKKYGDMSTKKSNSNSNSNSNSKSNTVDGYTGLRIVNRRLSRMEMADQLSNFEFHTCVQLCSMSRKSLESMIDNNNNNNNNNGGGRMKRLATMGLVFSKSGTKLSKQTKAAFSIVTMGGTLETGPTITVFLFGTAYSKYTSILLQPGKIISIQSPTLLPPSTNNNHNNKDNTLLSFSINDPDQLSIVGTCQDYGICAGHNSNNNKNHHQQTNMTRCRQYVDLRYGRYCRKHQHETVTTNHYTSSKNKKKTFGGGGGGKSNNNNTFVQRMKMDSSIVVFPNHHHHHHHHPPSSTRTNNSLHDALSAHPSVPFNTTTTTTNNNTTTIVPLLLQRAPLQMSKTKGTMNQQQQQQQQQRSRVGVSLDSILSGTRTGKTTTKTKTMQPKRKLARFDDFDGAVQRPKPNRLFRKTTASPLFHPTNDFMATTTTNTNITTKARDTNDILEKQRQLAHTIQKQKQKQKQKQNHCSNTTTTTTTTTTSSRQPQQQPPNNYSSKGINATCSITGQTNRKRKEMSAMKECGFLFKKELLSQEEKQRIVSTKSQFANEVEAEQYVKHRKAVMALERREDHQNNNNNNNKNNTNGTEDSRIVTEWKCTTCQKIHRHRPKLCIAYNHKVVIHRRIQNKLTAVESRLKNNNGMVLGAGLEWSGRFQPQRIP